MHHLPVRQCASPTAFRGRNPHPSHRPLRAVADVSIRAQSLEVDDSKPACQALDIDAGVHLAQREGVAKHETPAAKCVLGDSGFDQGCLGRFELG